ncbi:Spherulation-specific family 4-domain-containing protein [Infundibulicybe gibba]|nr:Spherulation-specific family 4-domain-containing protein [Infundibulicybe gibba]
MPGCTFFLWLLALLTFCVSPSLALLPSGIIFPLYIYPFGDCVAWTPVISAIQDNDSLQFYIVVNPNNGPVGPGGAPGNQPDANYQTCIAALRTAGSTGQNIKILGYVATGHGTRDSADVDTDIDIYSQWGSAYRPDGIFFDQVATSASLLPTYQGFVAQAHNDFGTSFIVLNPSANPASDADGYFDIADLVVTLGGLYNDFRRAVLLTDGPLLLPFEIVDELASTLDVGASFITHSSNAVAYQVIPVGWDAFVQGLITAQPT